MIEFASGIALSTLTVTELTGNGWAAPLAPPPNQTSLPEQLAANSYCCAASRRALGEAALLIEVDI
jgi:hypothetical protein